MRESRMDMENSLGEIGTEDAGPRSSADGG
jgi:hypothetical protein